MDADLVHTAYDWLRHLDEIAKQSPWYHWWLFDVWRLVIALTIYVSLGLLAFSVLSFFVYYVVFLPVHVMRLLPKLFGYCVSRICSVFVQNHDEQAEEFSQRKNFSEHHQDTAQFDVDSGLDPREILGVGPTPSREEITMAYREKMKQNHPDRLAHLDPELRKFATFRAQRINDAYQKLLNASG